MNEISISVIIPLAPNEIQPKSLLASLPENTDIILSQKEGRAASLNHGAAQAKGEYLWFLHADSELSTQAWRKLITAIKQKPNALHYFRLAFFSGSDKMKINAWGANFRSSVFGCPFGDQGLCISSALFDQLQGFPEDLEYGEDHVFVWKARQQDISLNEIDATITTSARKYNNNGWLKTTLSHICLWIKQAWPEWKQLRKIKNEKNKP